MHDQRFRKTDATKVGAPIFRPVCYPITNNTATNSTKTHHTGGKEFLVLLARQFRILPRRRVTCTAEQERSPENARAHQERQREFMV